MKAIAFIIAGLILAGSSPALADVRDVKLQTAPRSTAPRPAAPVVPRQGLLLSQKNANSDADRQTQMQQQDKRPGSQPSPSRLVPLSTVIANIARRTPGQQLNTTTKVMDGREVYLIRWQTTDGRRVDFIVDATTGSIISSSGG